MDKFIVKQTQVSTDNQSVDLSILTLDIFAYNDLAIIENIDYEDVIEDVISKNTKKMMFKETLRNTELNRYAS